jgi:hypothetical protein
MATYLEGAVDYIPQIQPFAPNLNLYANVLQTKQSKYDSNWKSLNNVYSQYFYADLTKEENQERRDDLMTAIDFNLKKVSGLDLSLEQNVRQAKQLFTPFYEDKYLMRDMVYTKTYQQEMNRAMSAKNCVGKDCEGTYWDGGVELLNYQLDKFKNASLEESLNVAVPSYTPYFDLMTEANELVKKYDYEIVVDSSHGGYMVREKNGPNAVGSLNDFILQNFMNNPRAVDYYRAQAQLNYYKDPDKAYQKYQTLMNPAADPTKPADPAVRAQIQDEQNENVLNETKLLFSTITNKTDDEIKNLEYEKLLLEKKKETYGPNWELTDEAKELEAINRELENKNGLQSGLDPLNTQIQSIQYKDKDGKPLSEEQLVGTVAMGLLMGDALNTAQTIAINKYSRTITGVDPYAMANYKAKMKAIYSGGSSGGSGSPKPTQTDEIITTANDNADKYAKSDEGKAKIKELEEIGYNETTAKQEVQRDYLREQKKLMEKTSIPISQEVYDKLDQEIEQLDQAIGKVISKDIKPTEKANTTLNFARVISGVLEFDYTGAEGKTVTKKLGLKDVRGIYENTFTDLLKIPLTAIDAARASYETNLSTTTGKIINSNRTNQHFTKALNDYIRENNLKPEENDTEGEFETRVLSSFDFQRSLVEPLFELEEDVIVGYNEALTKQAEEKAKGLLKRKEGTIFGRASAVPIMLYKSVQLAKLTEPNKHRAAYLESLRSMGFSDTDLLTLQTDYITLDQQLDRMYRFNEQNKIAFDLTGNQWLNLNGYKKNKFPKVLRNVFTEKHPFETIISAGQGFGGSQVNTEAIQKYIFYRNPFIQNIEGYIKINDRYNPVRNFVDTFIKDGKVDDNLKYLINVSTARDSKDPKKFRENAWVDPAMDFSEEQKASLRKAGYWKDGKILKFFNDIIPNEELMLDMTVDMLQGLNSRGSRGNIFALNPFPSDWAFSARATAAGSQPIADATYLPKIDKVLDWVSTRITESNQALDSDFKWGNKTSDMSFVPLYINGKGQSFEKTEADIVLIKDILFKDEDLKKLFEIKTEFQTYSQYSNDYSTVTFKFIPRGEYKNKNNKSKQDTYGHLVDKDITVHFPTTEDADLNRAKEQDYLSNVTPGTKYKSLDNYTTVVVNGVENGNLLINVSDIYFENNEKKINTFERSIPVASSSNWNEFIVNMLLDYSAKRNY